VIGISCGTSNARDAPSSARQQAYLSIACHQAFLSSL
jgi:hypothetical protein